MIRAKLSLKIKRQVVNLLNKGMTRDTIARSLNISTASVTNISRIISRFPEFVSSTDGFCKFLKGKSLHHTDELFYLIKPHLPSNKPKGRKACYFSESLTFTSRTCLMCGKSFPSYGPQNRRCGTCTQRVIESPVYQVNGVECIF